MGVHWDVIVLYPRDVKSFYLVGLEVRVPINVFDVDLEELVDDHFIIGVKPIK